MYTFISNFKNGYRCTKSINEPRSILHVKEKFQNTARSEVILLLFTSQNKIVTKLVIMSLTCTGPDRKKIKLQSSHVSHLLIITNSPKISIGITHEAGREAAVFVFDSFSFRFVSSTWHVNSISDVFLFMLPRFLSWAMLIFWRSGCGKVSLIESVRSHGHFVSFDLNVFWQDNIDTRRGGVRVSYFTELVISSLSIFIYFEELKSSTCN